MRIKKHRSQQRIESIKIENAFRPFAGWLCMCSIINSPLKLLRMQQKNSVFGRYHSVITWRSNNNNKKKNGWLNKPNTEPNQTKSKTKFYIGIQYYFTHTFAFENFAMKYCGEKKWWSSRRCRCRRRRDMFGQIKLLVLISISMTQVNKKSAAKSPFPANANIHTAADALMQCHLPNGSAFFESSNELTKKHSSLFEEEGEKNIRIEWWLKERDDIFFFKNSFTMQQHTVAVLNKVIGDGWCNECQRYQYIFIQTNSVFFKTLG